MGDWGGHHTVTVLDPGCPLAAGDQQCAPAEIRLCDSVTVEKEPTQIRFSLRSALNEIKYCFGVYSASQAETLFLADM